MNIINTLNENKTAIELFKEYTTGSEVSRIRYPTSKRKKNVGVVSTFLRLCRSKSYIDTENKPTEKTHKKGKNKGKKFIQRLPHIRLNLKPLFEIFEENNVFLNKNEQSKIINFLNNQKIRKFIVDWNINKNVDKNRNNKERFQEDIYETLSIFIRSLEWYDYKEILISALGEKYYEENNQLCLEIQTLIKLFVDDVYKGLEKLEKKKFKDLSKKEFEKTKKIDFLFSKIDRGFKYYPVLFNQEDYRCN